jgi:hypothetical protein
VRYGYRDVSLMRFFSSQSINCFSLHREAVSFNLSDSDADRPRHPQEPTGSGPTRSGCSSGSSPIISATSRHLALPLTIQSWSLTNLQQRLFKTGGRLIRHARYFVLQLAESHLTSPFLARLSGVSNDSRGI